MSSKGGGRSGGSSTRGSSTRGGSSSTQIRTVVVREKPMLVKQKDKDKQKKKPVGNQQKGPQMMGNKPQQRNNRDRGPNIQMVF